MKKIIIFAGLSVSFNEANEILSSTKDIEVIYRKPVRRGDVFSCINGKADVIGIIDGVFHQSPSVGHKEILEAIKREIIVIGSSSMGALRASELDIYGMKGIGYVYNQYAKGFITSDDDVAIAFEKETLEPLSTPLVTMDFVFKEAVFEGIIDSEDRKELYNTSKTIFYPKRNYQSVIMKANLSENKKEALNQYILNSRDIKKEDGLELLKYIKEEII